MSVLDAASQLIVSLEGFSASPYQNPGDRPTIGYGTTFYEDGTAVTLDDAPIDTARALQLLDIHIQKILDNIAEWVTVDLTDDQTIALCSFQYNTGGLHGSTLLVKLNSGDYQGAANEFLRWTHSGGKVDQGLVYRRQKEEALFLEEPQ